MNLFRRETTGIGVDFGTSSVKVVQLTNRGGKITLLTYAIALQPNSLVADRSPDSIARMANMLRDMLQRARVGRGPVTAALPVLSVFSTVLEVPVIPAHELEAAVTLLAKNYVPSPLAEVVMGWTLIGPVEESPVSKPPAPALLSPSASPQAPFPAAAAESEISSTPAPAPSRQEVFLTAAPRDLVQRYTAVFERVGLMFASLEVESFPLARSLIRDDRRPTLLVDFGSRTTSFSIVERGYLRLNQAVDIGGEVMTNAVAKRLSLSPEDAEQRKRAEGVSAASGARTGTPNDDVSSSPAAGPTPGVTGGEQGSLVALSLRPLLMELITRAEVIRRLYEKKRGRALSLVQLIGGGARLPGLANFWTDMTGLPCEVGNPWKGIAVPAPLSDHLKHLGPSFAVAVGLALRPFDHDR